MATFNAKQVLSNLYGLMMEINYHRPDEEVLEELQQKPDPQIDKHLLKIKQLTAKLKAQQNTLRFQRALEQIRKLKEKGIEEIKKLASPQQQAQLIPLFRKFEELTKEDEASILEDQELLLLIEALKNEIDDDPQ
ncbi:hypothetical protein [Mucilaginibacter sp. 22184]|uniref:hypothetical protein n=1 Tax=Mucilaginibacter sp. 22184 TaxID=3453887 RepID=UPI003F8472A4